MECLTSCVETIMWNNLNSAKYYSTAATFLKQINRKLNYEREHQSKEQGDRTGFWLMIDHFWSNGCELRGNSLELFSFL